MSHLLTLSRAIDWLNAKSSVLANYLVLLSCLVSASNAGSRYLFNASSNGGLEIQWYLFGHGAPRCAIHAQPSGRSQVGGPHTERLVWIWARDGKFLTKDRGTACDSGCSAYTVAEITKTPSGVTPSLSTLRPTSPGSSMPGS